MLFYKFGKNKNKKGWLRVVEACVAIIILIGFSLVILNQTKTEETNLQEKVNELILEIEKDEQARVMIFDEQSDCNDFEDYLRNNIMKEIDFTFEFNTCEHEEFPNKEIFASSILMVSLDKNVKFNLYIWK